MCDLMIRFSDWDFAAGKISVFMMIHLLPYLRYCILRTLHYLTFSGEWYPSLFSISDLSIIMFKDTFIFLSEYVSSLSFLSEKFFQLQFTDGIVPWFNSIFTDPSFVFLAIFEVVVVLLYPSYSQMTSWFLVRFDSVQSDTSPNTRHHRSQLFPDRDFTSYLTSILSSAEVLEHMSQLTMNFSIKEGLHHIIVLDIRSVKLWSENSQSSVKREFDCRY